MARIIDITGTIYEGMWNLEAPFPDYHMRPLPLVPWVEGDVYAEIFEMHSQTGTYLETPGHFYGYEKSYLINDVDVADLTNRDCVVLDVGPINPDNRDERMPVTMEHILRCSNRALIRPGDAILLCTHWGGMWENPDYLKNSPYMTREVMEWIVAQRPFLLGSDFPRFEIVETPQGIFDIFAPANILLFGPAVNLETVRAPKVKLTALPLKIVGTCCTPCRAVIAED
ncbi:MAG: cyclase family protein [Clostridiales bacterium]|nr:cyclase family protein [Clostridiales bacterium]